ncbi:MAG: hypothetical protein QF411_02695, partial [Planctomycetota bacterium]|nr:hypothetical protein [Planctomycetota bacterium]
MLNGPTGPLPPSRLRLPCLVADGFASRRDFLNGLLAASVQRIMGPLALLLILSLLQGLTE